MSLVEPGDRAPRFTLRDGTGTAHALKGYIGKPIVLYFYPKDGTSGCTQEACQFRDAMPAFGRVDAAVLGISPDDEASHATFAGEHRLNFPLLADTGRDEAGNPKVCHKYGVWGEKAMYGRKYMGVRRTTYLIDVRGKVARRWDRVKVPGHADEVLEAVRALRAHA